MNNFQCVFLINRGNLAFHARMIFLVGNGQKMRSEEKNKNSKVTCIHMMTERPMSNEKFRLCFLTSSCHYSKKVKNISRGEFLTDFYKRIKLTAFINF